MSFFDLDKIVQVVKTVSIIIAVGTLVAAVTPTKRDDVFMAKVRRVWIGLLSNIAGGIGYNVSADPCEEVDEQLTCKTTAS